MICTILKLHSRLCFSILYSWKQTEHVIYGVEKYLKIGLIYSRPVARLPHFCIYIAMSLIEQHCHYWFGVISHWYSIVPMFLQSSLAFCSFHGVDPELFHSFVISNFITIYSRLVLNWKNKNLWQAVILSIPDCLQTLLTPILSQLWLKANCWAELVGQLLQFVEDLKAVVIVNEQKWNLFQTSCISLSLSLSLSLGSRLVWNKWNGSLTMYLNSLFNSPWWPQFQGSITPKGSYNF